MLDNGQSIISKAMVRSQASCAYKYTRDAVGDSLRVRGRVAREEKWVEKA